MMGDKASLDPDALARLGSLDDPVRRRLYEYVRDCDRPAGRDQAAAATGTSRTLAAYHLDKLVKAGLLSASYARPPGRSGPGAGRPAKVYSRAERELAVSVPPRDYQVLAKLLVSSVHHDPTGAVRAAINEAAFDTGHSAGADSDGDLLATLRGCGYQPRATDDGRIELCNCPFHSLSEEHRDVVCTLNLHLIEGVLSSGDHEQLRAELAFRPNRCCVELHDRASATSDERGNESPTPG